VQPNSGNLLTREEHIVGRPSAAECSATGADDTSTTREYRDGVDPIIKDIEDSWEDEVGASKKAPDVPDDANRIPDILSANRSQVNLAASRSPLSFDEMLYTLSFFDHHHEPPMDLADKKDPSVREDLRIMDALSLLLVTGDESDAASAAFFRGPGRRLTVIFAKNRACTEDELLYIRQLKFFLLTLIQPLVDKGRFTSALFQTIFINCETQIRARHTETVRILGNLPRRVEKLSKEVSLKVWRKFRHWLGSYADQCNEHDEATQARGARAFLNLWIADMQEPLTSHSWISLVMTATDITSIQGIDQEDFMRVSLDGRTLWEAIRGYTQYTRAVQLLLTVLKRHVVDQNDLYMIEARSQPHGHVGEVKLADPLALLIRFRQSEHPNLPVIEPCDILKAFPELKETTAVAAASVGEHAHVHACGMRYGNLFDQIRAV
jgi:hypothetical protein